MEHKIDDQMKKMLSELSELMCLTYGNILKAVILYGSVAKGTQTSESDIDIIVLVDGDQTVLRKYEDKLCDVSTDISLKYLKVFSIIDISYQEYHDWMNTSPFYKSISQEGVVLYAA
jgi:predicted nucleotidyltransferase